MEMWAQCPGDAFQHPKNSPDIIIIKVTDIQNINFAYTSKSPIFAPLKNKTIHNLKIKIQ